MSQSLALIAVVVRDYDEAIGFYVGKLGFELVEDTYQAEQDKRWVVVRPKGDGKAAILLARASEPATGGVYWQPGRRAGVFVFADG